MNVLPELIAFVFLLFLSALFSSAEIAYTGLTLREINRVRKLYPRALELWEKAPDRLLATLFLSNNAVNVGVGVVTASLAFRIADASGWRKPVVTLVMSFVSGLILLVFGEIAPKIWAKRAGVSWALRVDRFMAVWSRFVAPVAQAAVRLTNALLLGLPGRVRPTPFLQESELKRILTHSSLPLGSKKILDNVITFSQSQVKSVMIDRNDIFAVSSREPMRRIIERVIQSGYSRVPVYEGAFDRMIGILYAKDLLVAWRSGALVVLDDLLRPVHKISPEMPLSEALRIFRSGRQHLSIVVKTGGAEHVEGLVTLQDALETIVGDIQEDE